jgi:O-antigen/teichoic acid export membrane protein
MLAADPLPLSSPNSKTFFPIRHHLGRLGTAFAVRWQRWRVRVVSVVTGQLAVQFLGFATGLLLLRWMSVEAFAQYGVAFGFQCMLGAFVDLGFSGSIVSLVGVRGEQREVVGGYIAAARWWRRILMILVTPIASVAFYFINDRQDWPLGSGAALFACIILTLYVSGWNAWASAPLLIHQRVGQMYRTQIAGAVARLAACAGLFALHRLDAVTLTMVNTAVTAGIAWSYWQTARPFFDEPRTSSPIIRAEMQRYLAPLLPGIIFYALQGQLSTLLISIFGRTQSVAEITALGRLAQLFTLLGAVHGMLVVPYFARLARELLASRYLLALGASVALAAVLTVASFLFPEPVLWILGGKYRHLQAELGWMVLANSLGFVGGVLWSIHGARKWIFWSGSFLYIGLITLTQIVFLSFVRMDSTLHVLYLSVATNVAVLIVHAVTAWIGFRWKNDEGNRPLSPPTLQPTL